VTDRLRSLLNSQFSRPRRARSQPGRYVAIRGSERIPVTKGRNGLWTALVDGEPYSNSILYDLRSQLEGFGFEVARDRAS
jgi:hypothetical protein